MLQPLRQITTLCRHVGASFNQGKTHIFSGVYAIEIHRRQSRPLYQQNGYPNALLAVHLLRLAFAQKLAKTAKANSAAHDLCDWRSPTIVRNTGMYPAYYGTQACVPHRGDNVATLYPLSRTLNTQIIKMGACGQPWTAGGSLDG